MTTGRTTSKDKRDEPQRLKELWYLTTKCSLTITGTVDKKVNDEDKIKEREGKDPEVDIRRS